MQSGWMIVAEGVLSFGVPIGLAVRELVVLNRPSRGGGTPPAPPPPEPPMPQLPARAVAKARVRVLEDA